MREIPVVLVPECLANGLLRVGCTVFSGAVLLHGNETHPFGSIGLATIATEVLTAMLAREPRVDLLLVGTGSARVALPPAAEQVLVGSNIAFEAMATRPAVRACQALQGDARELAVLLFPAIT